MRVGRSPDSSASIGLPSGDVDQRAVCHTREDSYGCETGVAKQRHELVAMPLAHGQGVLLTMSIPCFRSDRHVDAAVVLNNRVDAAAQGDRAARGLAPVAHVPEEWLFL